MKIEMENGIDLDLEKLKENMDTIKEFRLSYYNNLIETYITELRDIKNKIDVKLNSKTENKLIISGKLKQLGLELNSYNMFIDNLRMTELKKILLALDRNQDCVLVSNKDIDYLVKIFKEDKNKVSLGLMLY